MTRRLLPIPVLVGLLLAAPAAATDDFETLMRDAVSMVAKGDRAAAAKALNTALALRPDDHTPSQRLCAIYPSLNEPQLALEHCERWRRMEPNAAYHAQIDRRIQQLKQGKPLAGAPPPKRAGFLTVTAKRWGSVLLDGKQIAAETPLVRREVPAGKRRVEVCLEGDRDRCETREVEIGDGKTHLIHF